MIESEVYGQYIKWEGGVSSTEGWIWGVELEREVFDYNRSSAWALANAWVRLFASSLP
jgi:hypothetical protein